MNPRRFLPYPSILLILAILLLAAAPSAEAGKGREQTRASMERVEVPIDQIRVGDGDTMVITWDGGDKERVRVLGIDTPEIGHKDHFITEDQAYGPEARLFAEHAFANAQKIELIRAEEADGYGRTLGYFFLDGENYSVQVVQAKLAYESVQYFGDNGFPDEARAVLDAWFEVEDEVKERFEPPYKFRQKMREKQEAEKEAAESGKKDAAASGS